MRKEKMDIRKVKGKRKNEWMNGQKKTERSDRYKKKIWQKKGRSNKQRKWIKGTKVVQAKRKETSKAFSNI